MSARADLPALRRIAWDRYWTEVYRPGVDGPGDFTRWAVPYLRSAGVRRVVDLGCGPARDLRFLVGEGFEVTGIDGSPAALALARRALDRLPAERRRTATLVRADVVDGLAARPAGSAEAVHAAATYQGLTRSELRRLFREVHRVLVPGGVHVWSVRSDRHAGTIDPASVPPNVPGLGFVVPLRFLSREECARLSGPKFERWALVRAPGSRTYYAAYRKRVPSIARSTTRNEPGRLEPG